MGHRPWRQLAEVQAGLLSHRQLREVGVSRGVIRNHVRVGRWAARSRGVVSTTTGPLPGYRFFRTRRPLAVLVGTGELPVCRLEPAVLMFAAREPHLRTATAHHRVAD